MGEVGRLALGAHDEEERCTCHWRTLEGWLTGFAAGLEAGAWRLGVHGMLEPALPARDELNRKVEVIIARLYDGGDGRGRSADDVYGLLEATLRLPAWILRWAISELSVSRPIQEGRPESGRSP